MPDALDLHDFGITTKLIHNTVIANPNSVGSLRTTQFLRAVRQRLVSELFYRCYDARHHAGEGRANLSW